MILNGPRGGCCCCPPIEPNLIDGDDPGPDWEVISGSAPTTGNWARLNTPGTVVICKEHFELPWQTIELFIEPFFFIDHKRKGGRLIFDFHDGNNYQFLECLWAEDYGGDIVCDDASPRPHLIRFGGVSSGSASYQSEQLYFGTDSVGLFYHVCIRPDGLVIHRPYLGDEEWSAEYSRAYAVQTTVTSSRFGFGLGPETDVDGWVLGMRSQAFTADDKPFDGECPNCSVVDPAMAARFQNWVLPSEIEVELPTITPDELGNVDCSCAAGTYVLPRNAFDYYAMEFPLDCDEYGFDCDDEGSPHDGPHHNMMRVEVFPLSGGLRVRARRYGYHGIELPQFEWQSGDIGSDLDQTSFSITADPVDLSGSGCVNDQAAYVRNS